MTEQNEQLLSAARAYVTELFQKSVDPKFTFHNLHHTQQVVAAYMLTKPEVVTPPR